MDEVRCVKVAKVWMDSSKVVIEVGEASGAEERVV